MTTHNAAPQVIEGSLSGGDRPNANTVAIGTLFQDLDPAGVLWISAPGATPSAPRQWIQTSPQGSPFPDPIDLWVNAGTGSDLNPGTQALPLRNLSTALNRTPAAWRRNCTIHLVGTTAHVLPPGFRFSAGVPIGSTASPLAIVGETWTDAVSGTVTGTTSDSVTDTSLTMSPDAFNGARILFDSGPATGMWSQIRTNDASTVGIWDGNLPIGVVIGTKFRVQTQASVIQFADAGWGAFDDSVPYGSGPIEFFGVFCLGTASVISLWTEAFCTVGKDLCIWDLDGGLMQLWSSKQLWGPLGALIGPPATMNQFNSGPSLRNGTVDVFDGTTGGGTSILRGVAYQASLGSATFLAPTDQRQNSTVTADGAAVLVEAGVNDTSPFPAAFTSISRGDLRLRGIVITNASGQAVTVINGGFAQLTGVTGSTGNGAFGLLTFGGFATFDGTTTVSGTAGQVSVGTTPPTTWAIISGTGVANDFTATGRGDVVMRV
jgi:hypothetical protein